jgi:hypothetical protein
MTRRRLFVRRQRLRELLERFGKKRDAKTGEWEIIGRPYTTNAGKDARARVKKVGQTRRHRATELGRA